MLNRPLVSVIIPIYNGAAYLEETLQSVFAQDYNPMEILLIDDGSTDTSLDIVSKFKDKVTLIVQKNRGVAVARNVGLRNAKGEFITFLDQDDIWTADKTSKQVFYLEMNQNIDYVLCRQKLFVQSGMSCPSWLNPERLEGDHAGYLLGTLLGRRSVFNKVGFFDEQYRSGGDDSAWFFTAKDMKIPVGHMPDILFYKRIHNANESANVVPLHRDLLHIIRKSIVRQREGLMHEK